jgi:hypothetical protein
MHRRTVLIRRHYTEPCRLRGVVRGMRRRHTQKGEAAASALYPSSPVGFGHRPCRAGSPKLLFLSLKRMWETFCFLGRERQVVSLSKITGNLFRDFRHAFPRDRGISDAPVSLQRCRRGFGFSSSLESIVTFTGNATSSVVTESWIGQPCWVMRAAVAETASGL